MPRQKRLEITGGLYHVWSRGWERRKIFRDKKDRIEFLNRLKEGSDKPLEIWLQGVLNKKLIHIIIEQSKCKVKTERELNRKEIGKLVYTIKNLKLSINDTKGFKGAEVATGGINTTEVNPQTMESKLVPNLYFAGEILDVDGDRGGFNFHFAWVSGLRAGNNL